MGAPNPDPDEQAALLALDALEADEQADAELRHGAFPAELTAAAAALADATELPPPPELRGRVLAEAGRRRPPGRPAHPPAPCSPREAFERTVGDFAALLADLDADEWNRPAHDDHGTVKDLVAHLVGVERLSVGWLDPEHPSEEGVAVDHLTATRPAIDELHGADASTVAARWERAAWAVAEVARRGDPARPVHFHDLVGDVDTLLVMRTFELWAHGMDIALATGRPLPALDDERMAMMSGRLMAAVPLALAVRGTPVPDARVRFVLTGPAGGTYDVPLGAADADSPFALTLVTDAVAICRVAARRLPAAALPFAADGDGVLADAVLAAVDAFARD